MIRERSINIAGDGTAQPFSATDLPTRRFTVQLSNGAGAAVAFVKNVLNPAAPGAINGTTANFDLAAGQANTVEADRNAADRGEQFNLKYWFVTLAAGNLYVTYQEEVFNEAIT